MNTKKSAYSVNRRLIQYNSPKELINSTNNLRKKYELNE